MLESVFLFLLAVVVDVMAGLLLLYTLARNWTLYSITITRRDATLVEQPYVEHHYYTLNQFSKDLRGYYDDLLRRDFETDKHFSLRLPDVLYTSAFWRQEFRHEDTSTVITIEAKVIKGFREFSDGKRRTLHKAMSLSPAQANTLRKEYLNIKYPVVDKRYYVYIVTRTYVNNYGDEFHPEVKVFRRLEGEGGALTSIYHQYQDAEIMANTSEYPMVIEVDGDYGRVRYKIDRQLF